MKNHLFFLFLLSPILLIAQKKPLDHSVYDGWENIDEKHISDDGNWIVYTILPQEGDGRLIIQSATNSDQKEEIPRGYEAAILPDNQHVIFKIRPEFKKIRQAKIDKKKEADYPKDSLAILSLSDFKLVKQDSVKSYQTPEEESPWIVFQKFPPQPQKRTDQKEKELRYKIDSLKAVINELKGDPTSRPQKKEDEEGKNDKNKGGELVFFNFTTDQKITFPEVEDYRLNKNGSQVAFTQNNWTKDSIRNAGVLLYTFENQKADTLLKAINTAKNFAFDDDGENLAFVAENDDDSKVKSKRYKLYLYKADSRVTEEIANPSSSAIPEGYSISAHGLVEFSKDGNKLFFGSAPIPPDKDTSLVDIDLVQVDIWHYKDDYLQPYQLKNLKREKNRNYLAFYDVEGEQIHQLGTEGLPTIRKMDEGNSPYFIGITDTNRRISAQWNAATLKDIYLLNPQANQQEQIQKDFDGYVYPSPKGKYILFYDNDDQNYYVYDIEEAQYRNISNKLKFPLYNELNDMPTAPYPYGIMGWLENDEAIYLYDRYDIWQVDPKAQKKPVRMTPNGRKNEVVYRYKRTDPEERYLTQNQPLLVHLFNDQTKAEELVRAPLDKKLKFTELTSGDYSFSPKIEKGEDRDNLIYTKENYLESPNLYLYSDNTETKLSALNPQQEEYNWGTAELYDWKTFSGKKSTGILYKPEDFDSEKEYPMILYFYERRSNSLNEYVPPAPTPSKLNISLFVSQGYLVFVPDIEYTVGHPGKSAYDYIVSAAETLAKEDWVDGKNMGIQGQSWGGYQVAYLITQTDFFKAAWTGAPVVNMFSAYGGIRWGTGLNRQFQYEKTQSRIGATIWEKPELYKENSPLFELPKVKTPVVIMHNDNDGAVPWYQGIEMFTALKRLGKPSWLLNYNGDDHNLIKRKNRKDIQIRELQFFDYLLKDKKPAKWISEGVPATEKGQDWGLEIED